MAVLFSSLLALVMGTVSAAKAVVTEIIPPAAALAGDIVAVAAATAWASVAWFIYCLRAVVVAAVAVATGVLPHAVTAVRIAAWSAIQASRLVVGVALQLLSYLWSLLSAAVAGAVRLAMVILPVAVALLKSVVGAALASVARFLCHLWSLLSTTAAVAVHTVSYAVAAAWDAAGFAIRASQPRLELVSKLLRAFYGRFVTAAAEGSPDMAQAAKNVARAVAEVSQPLLDMVSKQSRDLYGWLVATGAEKLKTDAANACAAAASEKLIPSDGALAVVSPMDSTPAQEILHDRGVVVYVYVLLAVALLAIAFVCGGVCALTLRSRLAEQEGHGDRRRSHPHQSSAAARGMIIGQRRCM